VTAQNLGRRKLLAGTATAALLACTRTSSARVIEGGLPNWTPGAASPPEPVQPGPWQFLTPEEAADVEALVDRLIPPDPRTPGGKDAGCAVFIDRQLAGPYGAARGLYMRPPFDEGAPSNMGPQSPLTPAMRYRRSLAALDQHCTSAFAGKHFHQLSADQQDKLIHDMQSNALKLGDVSGKAFFEQLLQNTREGFFADPIYGGNRDMVAWKMIGFPGTRYDYRDWVDQHNKKYPRPPVSIGGRPEWTPRQS
jgi:gluconate 2-dehydrogenase gamma chain